MPVDLLVIGGGINGAGIARDAAGRGLSVVLCEQADLAQATSSASTKLIHGGLRYLEQYEFRLVREALIEREVLLAAAPHIIWPLTFVLPHVSKLRPAWLVRLGLFLYDHLGGRKRLPGSRGVDFTKDPYGAPLKPEITKGFAYSDCWVEDSRLVVLNAQDARERGADVLTRTACRRARRGADGLWHVTLEATGPGGENRDFKARAVVNAAGPWVTQVLGQVTGLNRPVGLRLVKGSHLVVPKLYEGDQAYILQNDDRRIVFAIPYERDYTLLGTTDKLFEADPAQVEIDTDEIEYICRAANRYFRQQVTPADAIWHYSGVRPLYDDANENVSAVTRDYVFDVDGGLQTDAEGDGGDGTPPLLSVFGGKITTYRKLAEHALDKLLPLLGDHGQSAGASWTHDAPLPGGDIADADFDAYLADLQRRHAWLPDYLARRYARAYGTRTERILAGAQSLDDLGPHIGDELYGAEVRYLQEQEWARTADDILWRRSKLGLHLSAATQDALAAHLGETGGARTGDGARLKSARSQGMAAK
ncbi:glycerol-3-phosphate dehydrogenase [Rhodovibrio salinarum]|uniref:Glycerol-3-phosphate dehydrogenase n=1 Tax=Rhodovibrio salinarum TaxID=1087 RepID=A0A934V392_9PROT|nr:glycerol-3-phosphate dehydrogenase [Rhodovibrio salinarum]MBK1699179.1 glycerol-3-phosphate dehydrogenase [Rhodovibrio salinarum]